MQQLEFRAMGCRMDAFIDSDHPAARAALDQVPRWFEAWEQCLSRFREHSELSMLNRQPGRPVRVSDTLWQVTRLALQAAAQTDGLITPTILDALEAAGYDHSLSEPIPTTAPAGKCIREALLDQPKVHDWRAVRMDRRRRTITLPHGVRLDVAGVAKGWAAEQAARRLGRVAPAMVNASGDVAVSAPRADGSSWPLSIENPFGKDDDLPLLLLNTEAEATSSRRYRSWLRGDKWQHHLIDARTGAPAETDVFSSTVVAPDAVQAEVGAKVALILGSRAGLEWIQARPGMAALLVLDNGQVIANSRFLDYCWREE
jgi:FAD:protein FMN transferase